MSGDETLRELVALAARTEMAEQELAEMRARVLPFFSEQACFKEQYRPGFLEMMRRQAAVTIGRMIFDHERGVAYVGDHSDDTHQRVRYRVDVLLREEES
jgi:hypothetical protein